MSVPSLSIISRLKGFCRSIGLKGSKEALRSAYMNAEYRRAVDVKDGEESSLRRALRLMTEGAGGARGRKLSVTLVPMRSLSLEDYTFPFGDTGKIRDALRLQLMPFSAAGESGIFPVTLRRNGRISEGIVWYVSPDELPPLSSGTVNAGSKFWPAPLAFISELKDYDGNGVTVWADEENVCSLMWQSYKPVLYRWCKRSDNETVKRELKLFDVMSEQRGYDRGGSYVYDTVDGEDFDGDGSEIAEIVSESVSLCSWLNAVNLSRSELEGARDLERTVNFLTAAALGMLICGVLVLAGGFIFLRNTEGEASKVSARSEAYYRSVFEPDRKGRISNPVRLAREKTAELTGKTVDEHGISEVLGELGEIFGELNGDGTSIEILRYNSEGIDCTGTAKDMTAVLNFRNAWEGRAGLVQVDNTQLVAGIGYRFDIRIRW